MEGYKLIFYCVTSKKKFLTPYNEQWGKEGKGKLAGGSYALLTRIAMEFSARYKLEDT